MRPHGEYEHNAQQEEGEKSRFGEGRKGAAVEAALPQNEERLCRQIRLRADHAVVLKGSHRQSDPGDHQRQQGEGIPPTDDPPDPGLLILREFVERNTRSDKSLEHGEFPTLSGGIGNRKAFGIAGRSQP
jgi:hypothetical protein